MIPPNMLAPGRIEGMRIAAGRATWVCDDDEDGKKGYYNFVDEDSFSWMLNPTDLKRLEIDEPALLDCVTQAEEQFGAPCEYRPRLGLFPNAGYTNIGATYVSRSNPQIMCVFTPTSTQFPTGNAMSHDIPPVDAYFEWYYSPVALSKDAHKDIGNFLQSYDKISGNRASNVVSSPIIKVPSYEEASVFTVGYMAESIRDHFLQQIWNYHRMTAPGYKRQLREEIVDQWKRVLRARVALSMYED